MSGRRSVSFWCRTGLSDRLVLGRSDRCIAGRSQHRLDWLSAYESFSCRSDGRIATHGRTQKIESLLAGYREQGLDFHALRTRQAGGRAFMTMHILVLGDGLFNMGTTGPSV